MIQFYMADEKRTYLMSAIWRTRSDLYRSYCAVTKESDVPLIDTVIFADEKQIKGPVFIKNEVGGNNLIFIRIFSSTIKQSGRVRMGLA